VFRRLIKLVNKALGKEVKADKGKRKRGHSDDRGHRQSTFCSDALID